MGPKNLKNQLLLHRTHILPLQETWYKDLYSIFVASIFFKYFWFYKNYPFFLKTKDEKEFLPDVSCNFKMFFFVTENVISRACLDKYNIALT